MSRGTMLSGCGVMILGALFLVHAQFAKAQYMPPVETPIEQATARVAGNKLTVVRVISETVLETREESFTVTVKVAREVIEEATQQKRVIFEDVPETRTRTVTVPRQVYKQVMLTFDVGTAQAAELSGAKVDAAALKSRLAKQGLILISNMGQPAVPEAFKILFKPETIVLDLSKSPPVGLPPVPAAPAGAFGDPIPVVPVVPPVVEGELPKVADFPPQFRLASIDADKQFVLKAVSTRDMTSTRFLTVTEKRIVDGKEVPTIVCKPISVTERQESSHAINYPADAISGVTVDGQPLDDRHRDALAQKEIPVVVSASGKPVESFWLQNIKPKMLVLTAPLASPPSPPGPLTPPGPVPAPVFGPPTPVAPAPVVPAPVVPIPTRRIPPE